MSIILFQIQIDPPYTFIAISGDFDHASLSSSLPIFKQCVQRKTGAIKTLGLLYANGKEAYSFTSLPRLGKSDHYLLNLKPDYTSVDQQQSPPDR